jgi:hypothetical protein
MLVKQACATMKRKYRINAEPGWFPDEWDSNTIHKINEALGLAPEVQPEESLTFEHKGINVAGFIGHIMVMVGPVNVYFHNR